MSLTPIVFVAFQTQIINTNFVTLLKHSFMVTLNIDAIEICYVFYCSHVKASADQKYILFHYKLLSIYIFLYITVKTLCLYFLNVSNLFQDINKFVITKYLP